MNEGENEIISKATHDRSRKECDSNVDSYLDRNPRVPFLMKLTWADDS